MQVNLFKILAITAALSTVQSAPVEIAEGPATREQVEETHTNEAVVDDAAPQKGCVREKAPHISTRPCDASDPCSGQTEQSRIPGRPQTALSDAYLPYYPDSILIARAVNITWKNLQYQKVPIEAASLDKLTPCPCDKT